MAYFNELPDFEYISNFDNKNTNEDYIKVKNIFIRAKVREDILNYITSLQDYYVKENERPDQIAQKFYEDSELDWVILLTNNITDIQNQWPLDGNCFNRYLLDKYGFEEKLNEIHHYETVNVKDQFNRDIIKSGYQVDTGFSRTFATSKNSNVYKLPLYKNSNLKTTIEINLNQILTIYGRFDNINCKINDINTQTSNLKIKLRSGNEVDVKILNSFDTWPSSWGGVLNVYQRNSIVNVRITDEIGDKFINIPESLYEFKAIELDEEVITTFNFIPQ